MTHRDDLPLLITLQWIALVAAIFVTGVGVYDLINGENNMTTWFSVTLWPVVGILSAIALVRLYSRRRAGE